MYVSGDKGSFYGISKKIGEMLCKRYAQDYNLNYSIVRYGSLYGRGANDWNLIYRICNQVMQEHKITYFGDGEELREFINVKDATRETVRIAELDEFRNKSVMISGLQKMKIKDLLNIFNEIMPYDITIQYKEQLKNKDHYEMIPYKYESDIPVRVNMASFVDIGEGIMDCLKEAEEKRR